jgi:hypothetical protein
MGAKEAKPERSAAAGWPVLAPSTDAESGAEVSRMNTVNTTTEIESHVHFVYGNSILSLLQICCAPEMRAATDANTSPEQATDH